MSVKRLVVTVVGGTILGIGLVLLVLPGPAFVVIPLGLAVLATEYVWARRWLKRAKNMANPRRAKRTTRVLRQAFGRRWKRWKSWLRAWVPGKRDLPVRPHPCRTMVAPAAAPAAPPPVSAPATVAPTPSSAPPRKGVSP